jgi:hypothetical protein
VASITVRALGTCAAVVLIGAWPLAAADLEQYRGFRLGSSTAAALTVSGAVSPRDLKTTLLQPELLQELEWRPPLHCDWVGSTCDPVRRVILSFVADHLGRIVVEYERSRTEGLSRADMVKALSVAYGPPDRLPSREGGRSENDALDGAAVVARWRTTETVVTLQRNDYIGGYVLVVASVRLERRARQAQAAWALINGQEAAAGDAALLGIRANAAREAERTRSANKASFTP